MSTPRKQIGYGTLVKVDHAANGTYVTIGCTRSAKLPDRMSEKVDATCLTDVVEQFLPGIETDSECEIDHIWDPTNANHQIIETLKDSKAVVNWQIVLPFATPVTATFAGFVLGYTTEPIQRNNVIARTVKVQRTGAITYA